jgi:outer membrane receptor for Fe3+-dicitrate
MENYRTYSTAFSINIILKSILLTFLLITAVMGVFAQTGNSEKKISISFTADEKLDQALKKLEKVTGISMAFDPRATAQIPVKPRNFVNTELSVLLRYLLSDHGFSFKNESGSILIFKNPKPVQKQQPGKFRGKITDEEDGQPLIGATISIGGNGASTDTSGIFNISLQKGKYLAEVSSIGYGTKRITDIVIQHAETMTLNIPLKKDKGNLNTVNISARRVRETGTNAAIVDEIRNSDAVVSGISKEQIARSQDRDAAEVVRRIPGVSVMQNRFIIIRGLSQRYNTVMLNGVIAPSFEADSRAFSFDVMPSSMIDRVMIYKTAMPELPGDFAGGVVKVYTTGMPVKNAFNVSYMASFRQGTSLKSFFEQPRGSKAWLGYDDGTYALPKEVKSQLDLLPLNERRELTKKFNDNWEAGQKIAPVDRRLNIDLARRIQLGDKVLLGIVSALGLSDTYGYQVISRNTGKYVGGERDAGFKGTFEKALTFTDQSYVHDVRLSGLMNVSLNIGNEHRLEFKNLYTHLGSSAFVDRSGLGGKWPGDDALQGQYIKQQMLSNAYREIYSGQLSGNHKFFKNSTEINWIVAYTRSDYDDPDQRGRMAWGNPATYYGKSSLPWYTSPDPTALYRGRQYYTLPDTTKTVGFDIAHQFKFEGFEPKLKAGVFIEDKGRSFEFKQLGLVTDKEPGNLDGLVMDENFGPWNSYRAANLLQAGYISTDIPFGAFKLSGGLRIEKNRQQLQTHSRENLKQEISLDRRHTSLLPSANLSYNLTQKSLFKVAYSKTLNRPEFREISDFFYLDLYTGRQAFGNPDLKIQTDIDNLDLRFEHYPATGEMFTVGLFYKKFKNPIEFYYYSGTSGPNNFQWDNARSAVNYGAEVELMLGLSRYFDGGSWTSKQMQKLSILFNATYIHSRVDLGDNGGLTGVIQDKKRPLYGQSPYLFNSSLNYTDDDNGLKLTATHNVIGKRLFVLGNIEYPSGYELPRHSLDLTFSKKIAKIWELKGGVQNILNSPNLIMQDISGDNKFKISAGDFDQVDNRYQSAYEGVYYSLGIGIKL